MGACTTEFGVHRSFFIVFVEENLRIEFYSGAMLTLDLRSRL